MSGQDKRKLTRDFHRDFVLGKNRVDPGFSSEHKIRGSLGVASGYFAPTESSLAQKHFLIPGEYGKFVIEIRYK